MRIDAIKLIKKLRAEKKLVQESYAPDLELRIKFFKTGKIETINEVIDLVIDQLIEEGGDNE